VAALNICGDRIRRRERIKVRAIATQACRAAENGAEFLDRVERESGLRLEIITPKEEARLSVAGSVNLLDRSGRAALVLDVGGGSTELCAARHSHNCSTLLVHVSRKKKIRLRSRSCRKCCRSSRTTPLH